MRVGDLVIGTDALYDQYGDSEIQLPRGSVGKIIKTYLVRNNTRYVVEWVSDEWHENGYNRGHLRVVSFNVYLTQIER